MNAFIDRSGCIGCGLCPTLCPAVFAMAEDGLAEVVVPEIPGEAESAALEAQQNCPVMVISVN
ncbi:MAG: ferredoxin [Angelakisella sp.]|jgi:ferredoxin|nr:ferredoxin [Angelakisella sp.]MCI9529544.1 ferredoxin [Angelakisella sp.]